MFGLVFDDTDIYIHIYTLVSFALKSEYVKAFSWLDLLPLLASILLTNLLR